MKVSWVTQIFYSLKTNNPLKIILLLGLVSFFGDTLYEGARSISGPYLKLLGANAFWVGFIFGLGEFFNFALRLPAGYLVDKTKHYWPFMFIGYYGLFVIPLLAFANTWYSAALLFLSERLVKAIRSPAKDAIVSFAAQSIGTGLGFGIHEFTDQLGGIIGPLFFSLFLATASHNSLSGYQQAFSYLWIAYVIMICVLFLVYQTVKTPQKLEHSFSHQTHHSLFSFSRIVYLYLVYIFISIIGFTNFSLIGYHLKKTSLIPEWQIPLVYAIAMALVGITAVILGNVYDIIKKPYGWQKASFTIFAPATLLLTILPITALSLTPWMVYISMLIMGIAIGSQTTIRALFADLVSKDQRATIYGIYNFFYGTAFLLGSTLMGYIYDVSRQSCIAFIAFTQLIAFVFLIFISYDQKK